MADTATEGSEKMKLYRFMSGGELERLLKGDRLENTSDWRAKGQDSDSIGFCFFGADIPITKRIRYMTGVVSMDFVVEFETTMKWVSQNMKQSMAVYRDPWKDDLMSGMVLSQRNVEFSIQEYDRKMLKVLRLGKPQFDEDNRRFYIEWVKVKKYGGGKE